MLAKVAMYSSDVFLLMIVFSFSFTEIIEARNAVIIHANRNETPSSRHLKFSTKEYIKPQNEVKIKRDILSMKNNDGSKFVKPYDKSMRKIHQPREDPRLFYQSKVYLQELNNRKAYSEVSFIYPGQEVVRAEHYPQPVSFRVLSSKNKVVSDIEICIRCPFDRKLISKTGTNRAFLQKPRMLCSGRKASKAIRFVQNYGPKLGSFVKEGSHTIVGTIMYKDKQLKTCKMQVDVESQVCTVKKYLKTKCENQFCNFTCKNSKHELIGPSTLECIDEKWSAELPFCITRVCGSPVPPDHGHISCSGVVTRNHMAAGAKCRVKCARGWRSGSHRVVTCRHGEWSGLLICLPN